MEIYSSFCFEILNISEKHLHQMKNQPQVSISKRISKLEKIHQELIEKSIPFSIQTLEEMEQNNDDNDANESKRQTQNQIIARNFMLTKKIREKIHGQRILKSFQLITRNIFQQADGFIDKLILLDKNRTPTISKMDIALTLMRQYMTCANRFEKQLKRSHFFGNELVYRVFQLVDFMETQQDDVVTTNQMKEEEQEQEKIKEFYWLAARTCGLLWRVQETEELLTRKKKMFNQKQLDIKEYDLLIFLQCAAKKNVQNAYAILQEMHNAGIPPSKDTLHRIVVCRLQQKRRKTLVHMKQQMDQVLDLVGEDTQSRQETEQEKWLSTLDHVLSTTNEEQDIEDDVLLLGGGEEEEEEEMNWSTMSNTASSNSNPADIISFLQKWHNMTRVTPYGKTVVPILAQLLKKKDFYELARFIQLLNYMGMTPATKVWLEKQLALYGKTLDEFNFSYSTNTSR
jgi:hypothetical protein